MRLGEGFHTCSDFFKLRNFRLLKGKIQENLSVGGFNGFSNSKISYIFFFVQHIVTSTVTVPM